MVDAVESTEEVSRKIEESAREIKKAAAVAKQNGEKCRQIENRVDRVLAMLDWLSKSKTAREAVIRSDLEDLRETLDLALKLVTGCQQEKKVIWLRCVAVRNLSKRLRQVNKNIRESIARLVNNVHNNIVFGTQNFAQGILSAPPEDAVDESSHHSSDDTRSQVEDDEITNDLVGREADRISSLLTEAGIKLFEFSILREITRNFSDDLLIGENSEGKTYKANFQDGTVAAVKRLYFGTRGLSYNYARVLSVLGHHNNVARCVGYYHEDKGPMAYHIGDTPALFAGFPDCVVEEYYPNGRLEEYMYAGNLDWSLRFQLIRGIAEGVSHIHTKNIVHLDLHPENIILDAGMTPKISGFEQSKILDPRHTDEAWKDKFVGRQHYMAPEYMRNGIVSLKNDVYSFGVLLLCLVTQNTNVLPEYQDPEAHDLDERAETLFGLCNTSSMSEEKTIKGYIKIGLMCTEENPEYRCSMPEILDMLDGRKEILPAPERKKNARSEPAEPPSIVIFPYTELEVATHYFSPEFMISESHIATVYKGNLPDNTAVAIKRFRGSWGPEVIKQYKTIFSPHFQHQNIVSFLGYCEEPGKEMVVEDYLPSRSLSWIIDGPLKMEWSSRFQIIRGVANALDYLHSKSIIHFDLTLTNIIAFDTQMNPKISDFGLSKINCVSEIEAKEFEITAGSMAPEYADGVISVKNDIYSFGDLVCTLTGMSRSGPPQDLNDVAMVVRAARRMKDLFDPSLCKETELKQIKECIDIGLRCTRMERGRRPTIKEVLQILNKAADKFHE